MRVIFSLIFFACMSVKMMSQLHLNSGGKIHINGGTSVNPIFMVLNTPPATPITTTGSNNGIIMEAEFNRLQYNLGTAGTAITVPYMSLLLEPIPLTLSPTAAGVGAGNIRFSAKVPPVRATGFDNSSYMPSDVNNMHALPAVSNNSPKTIDRFWIIDANGYTTKPSVNLSFTYIDAEWAINSGNSITEVNLRAQRYNSNINDWGGYVEYLPTGSIDIGTNVVSNVVVPAADFFKSWTLNDLSIPLPVELVSFEAECVNNNLVFKWCTASEINNALFTIEQSANGSDFIPLTSVAGSINSTQKKCYSYQTDNSSSSSGYYRLSQTDTDGNKTYSNIIFAESCLNTGNQITITHNGFSSVGLIISYDKEELLDFNVYNSLGQIVQANKINVVKGKSLFKLELEQLSNGIYYVTVSDSKHIVASKKILYNELKD